MYTVQFRKLAKKRATTFPSVMISHLSFGQDHLDYLDMLCKPIYLDIQMARK